MPVISFAALSVRLVAMAWVIGGRELLQLAVVVQPGSFELLWLFAPCSN